VTLAEFDRRVAALTQLRVENCVTPVLHRDDAHHLFKVLRARAGEEVVLTDGRGAWRFAAVGDRDVIPVSEVQHDPAPPPRTIYMAPIKGERAEWAVAKATELGVTRLVPLVSRHVSVKFSGEARDKALQRWQRIALETAGQCRRTHDLVIASPVTPADVPTDVAIAMPGAGGSLVGISAVAIGPEGGFAEDEWSADHPRVGLGETVLRAETAVLAACVGLVSQGPGWAVLASDGGFSKDGG
jgi:16S rRNA (uracil1498-N3)-methyltransferase